jgi:hypothetical protein
LLSRLLSLCVDFLEHVAVALALLAHVSAAWQHEVVLPTILVEHQKA